MNGQFAEFYRSLDADPAKRGKQFERFVKWFLKNEPEWSTQVEQVWLWDEYPGRWGVDCGIDLVFTHLNGETWAVQAKCYSPEHHITKHDVDKFLSESNRQGIDKRLLIATTDHLGANAKQVCEAQEKTVVRYLLSNFELAEVEYPASFEDLPKAKRKEPPQPRPHQLEAITAVTQKLKEADRGQLIMACGTGKTFTTLWIKEALGANHTLVLLPSLGLLSQTLKEWTYAASNPFRVLCVCSDETVGKKGEDEAVSSVADLAFPVTSDVGEIRRFLAGSDAKVVFSTYQSSPLVADAQHSDTVPAFDLVIADEAHRCAGKADSAFSTVLDGARIKSSKRLFATATPRTYSTSVKKAAEDRGVDVVGMDDEATFGKVLHSLPFGEAITRGLLTDYRVVIIGVDDPTIKDWIERGELVETSGGATSDAASLASQIGLLKAIKDYDLKRVISFHSRVKRAEAFTDEIQNTLNWVREEHRPSGQLWSDFVSGAMPTDRRRQKLERLKALKANERGILTNARCLSEGVDVPALDGVAFIDPRSSQVDIVQAVGRAIRLSPDKKAGTIVLPVFIEAGDSPEESIEASNFKPVWDVLNALKAHDDQLSFELNQIRTELGRKSGSRINPGAFSKVTIDLPMTVDAAFGDSLRTILVERSTESWSFWYGLLQDYVENEGTSNVPQAFATPNGYRLGYWVGTQRASRAKLSGERKKRLEQLPGWSWDAFDEKWEDGFRHLLEYANKEGHSSPPHRFKMADGFHLGAWIIRQRALKSRMQGDRKARLEELPGWSWDPFVDKWEEGFRHLEEYVKQEKNCRPSQLFKSADGYRVGVWVSHQRSSRSNMPEERKARLEALPGWSWDSTVGRWEEGLRHLEKFIKSEGHSNVPQAYSTADGYRLGLWISTQRVRKQKMPADRKARLEALPGWSWDPAKDQWEEGLEYLQEYATREGHSRTPVNHVMADGYRLGQWVAFQRTRKSKMPEERKARLEALPGWSWDAVGDQWEDGFQHLEEYVSKEGHSRPTNRQKTEDGFPLGRWVGTQRNSRSSMPAERRVKLEALLGWSWDAVVDKWEDGFRHLEEYVRKEGHSRPQRRYIAADGFGLGLWVGHQRDGQLKLSEERKARLEALPGWSWDAFEDKWEEGYRHLEEYIAMFGHSTPPVSYKTADGYRLGRWVADQRYRKLKLPEHRRAKLEALPGWVWTTKKL